MAYKRGKVNKIGVPRKKRKKRRIQKGKKRDWRGKDGKLKKKK